MNFFTKFSRVLVIILMIAWLLFAAVSWMVGWYVFHDYIEKEGGMFTAWMIWGGVCAIPLIITMIKMGIVGAASGAATGANTYTATQSGNTVYVKNEAASGAFWGFIMGLFLGVAVGHIILPFFFIKNLIALIRRFKNFNTI